MTIVEIRGGTVVAVYSNKENNVIIVDHDDAEYGKSDAAGTLPIDNVARPVPWTQDNLHAAILS